VRGLVRGELKHEIAVKSFEVAGRGGAHQTSQRERQAEDELAELTTASAELLEEIESLYGD
jgi:hypothetical protein